MNAMQHRRQRRRAAGVVAFIAFVIVSGLILTATRNVEDPLASMADIVEMRQMLDAAVPGDIATAAIDVDIGAAATPAEAPTHNAIAWSAFGEVLYDLWFMCAVTAVVIVVGAPVRWLARRMSPQRQPASPHRARR